MDKPTKVSQRKRHETVDALFAEIEEENKKIQQTTNLDVTIRDSSLPPINNFDQVLPTGYRRQLPQNDLFLFEISSRGPWDAISNGEKASLMKENNVTNTISLIAGVLLVPFQKRKATTAKFFLHKFRQEGIFNDMYDYHIITHSETGEKYLLCCTVSRRINTTSLLIGNYLFKFDRYNEVAIEMESMCKKQEEEVTQVMRQQVVFLNFYFDTVAHDAGNPYMVVGF